MVVPSGLNAGRSLPRPAAVVSARMPSSLVTTMVFDPGRQKCGDPANTDRERHSLPVTIRSEQGSSQYRQGGTFITGNHSFRAWIKPTPRGSDVHERDPSSTNMGHSKASGNVPSSVLIFVVTGTISRSNLPDACAFAAFACESAEKPSCAALSYET